MAIAASHPSGADNWSTYASSLSTGSFTPAANSLLLLSIHRGDGAAPSVSSIVGHGTWTLVGSGSTATTYSFLYALLIGGSPSADTIDVTLSNNGRMEIFCDQFTGVDTTSINAALPQTGNAKVATYYNGGGGPFTETTTFDDAFGSANNFAFQTATSNGSNVTKDSTFTSLYDGGNDGMSAYKGSSDTEAEFTIANDFTSSVHIIAEIAEAASGTTITPSAGSLSIAGQAAELNFGLSPGDGSLSIAGQAVNVADDFTSSPVNGIISIAGQDVIVAVIVSINPANGTISIAGQDLTITELRIISPDPGSLSIAGQSVTVDAVFVESNKTGLIFKLVGPLVNDLIKEIF